MRQLTEAEALKLGNETIALLGLKVNRCGRVQTSWGDKTPSGLGCVIERITRQLIEADHE